MKRPGKTIEVKPEIKALLERHGFTRSGHHDGELYYDRQFFDEARLSVCARYRERDDDEWENAFRVELALLTPQTLADLRLAGGELLSEQDLRRLLAFACDTVEQTARRISRHWLPPANGETLSGFDGDWTCLCGNRSDGDGFFPCDVRGVPVSTATGEWTTWLNLCARCGRLFHLDSLEVHGTSALHGASFILSGRAVKSPVHFFASLNLTKDRALVIGRLAVGQSTRILDPDAHRFRTLLRVR